MSIRIQLGNTRPSSLPALGVALLGLALTACAADPPPTPARSPHAALAEDSPARPFVGKYRVIQRDAQNAEVQGAIEGVVSEMNGLIRGIARDKLVEANAIPQLLEVKAGDDLVAISMDGHTSSAPADGRAVKQTVSTGETMDVAMKVSDHLEESFHGEDRGRVNTFELRGDVLVMHVRIYAAQLPKDLEYDLEFQRI
ncbi:MAG: hypothetical protein U0414_36165 [Polyangiaceae bacterium]